jgi:hypothetical protein
MPSGIRGLGLAASILLTGCGQPLTIAAWMNAEPAAEVSVRIFRQTITGPLEGGVFTIIRLDLSNPLHDAGTDVFTPRTLWLLNPTDIRQDFEIGNATVVSVPPGARFLFLTPIDNHYDDNFSFDLRVGIDRAP